MSMPEMSKMPERREWFEIRPHMVSKQTQEESSFTKLVSRGDGLYSPVPNWIADILEATRLVVASSAASCLPHKFVGREYCAHGYSPEHCPIAKLVEVVVKP